MKKYALLLPILLSGCANNLDDLANLSDSILGKTHLSTEQLNNIDNLMVQSATTQEVKQAIIEARDNIKAVLDIEACSTDASPFLKYAAPKSGFGSATVTELQKMAWKYHDEKICLNVVKVHGWEMLAKNAMSFIAVYESEMTGNVGAIKYNIVKQSSNEWLFTTSYSTY